MSQQELLPLSAEEFRELARLIGELCGISLSSDKIYLVRQRLSHVAREQACNSFSDLIGKLKDSPGITLKDRIITSMVTTETSFFRDQKPFDLLLQKIFPRFLEESQLSPVNILCAGVSTGEEIYSLSILVHEYCSGLAEPRDPLGHFSLTGLDISPQVLEKAKSGVFSDNQISKGLKKSYLQRYFQADKNGWKAVNNLKRIISFRRYDLTSSIPIGISGTYDVIFCRNVLIYFDAFNKEKILNHFLDLLSERGVLVLGSSEVINNRQTTGFEPNNQEGCLYYTKSRKL